MEMHSYYTADQHQMGDFLTFGFLSGFEGVIPSPSYINHQSAREHPSDVASYIGMELYHGAMLAPFDCPTLFPWCQTSPLLLTRPMKGSFTRCIILDLSWPLPLAASVNGGIPRTLT